MLKELKITEPFYMSRNFYSMQRVNQFYHTEFVRIKDEIANKWCLPFIGPVYG